MKVSSKQLGEWATNSRAKVASNMFLQARLKLTFLYVLLLAVILAIFSIFLYTNLVKNISDLETENFSSIVSQQHYVHDASENIRDIIVVSDIVILLAASFLSYWLAGRTLKPISQSLLRQKEFTADASHELRTPLAAIKLESEVLLRNQSRTPEMVERTLRNVIDEIDSMTTMTDNLLLLARSDGRQRVSFEELDLNVLIEKTAMKLKDLALLKGILLNVTLSEEHLIILGDHDLLMRALINIIQNSLNHTPKGGTISISLSHIQHLAVIKMSDSGEGISEKHLPHIFKRFYKADSSRGTSGGSGLGLSIVKEIIDQHYGTVSIQSKEGKGTEVSIKLLLAKL